MDHKLIRTLLIAGFALNLAFLVIVLMDYAVWGGRYGIPIFIAWAIVIVLCIVLGLFAKPRMQVVERVVERVVVKTPEQAAEGPLYPQIFQPSPAQAAPPVRFERLEKSDGPFRFKDYTLYSREVQLKGGGKRPIYFFARSTPKSGSPAPKPGGYHVGVNERTGLPFLKKGTGPDGEDLTPAADGGYEPQCSALTAAGGQCRNSARHGSKYCASHFGYQPPAIAKAEAARKDTIARVRGAPDTKPSVRRRAAA